MEKVCGEYFLWRIFLIFRRIFRFLPFSTAATHSRILSGSDIQSTEVNLLMQSCSSPRAVEVKPVAANDRPDGPQFQATEYDEETAPSDPSTRVER